MALSRWFWVVAVVACGPSVETPLDPDSTGPDGDTETNPSSPSDPSDTDPSDTDPSDSDPSDTDPSDTDPSDTDPSDTDVPPSTRAVDVLFVIDNSGTMGEEQGRIASAGADLIASLDGAGLDWRIGVTTTDNGNPWCGSTSPEGGKLRVSSCRSRTNEFIFNGNPPQDATAVACTDICQTDTIDILPTDIGDGQAAPRPWLERTGGTLNVDVDAAEALACILPQGIDGCGFEQPLESMYKSLIRSETGGESEFGFIRPEALLVIVIVSDETDCSYNSDEQSIFLPESEGGNQVFWTDPNASAPTSAVCWNAGVTCTGGPGEYEECHADNKDVNGNSGVSEGEAVLHPVSRYVEFLAELEASKQQIDPAQQVIVAEITGVPSDFGAGGEIVYADAVDPDAGINFGIGPGCTGDSGTALPPVREREVAEAMATGDRPALFSVCDADYGPAIAGISALILDHVAGG